MKWGLYFTFFGFSTFKFLFTPLGGPAAGLNFFECYFSCLAGGIFSASLFYFLSSWLMERTRQKSANTVKKKFTKTNKFIVRIKRKLGKIGICFFAPLFLSVPVGTIVVAKFYGKDKSTFPLVLIGLISNGIVLCGLAYGVAWFF